MTDILLYIPGFLIGLAVLRLLVWSDKNCKHYDGTRVEWATIIIIIIAVIFLIVCASWPL